MDWISVEDRLPPKDGTKFLAFTGGLSGIEISDWYSLYKDEYTLSHDDLYKKTTVLFSEGWNSNYFTHWMPLPEPPE